MNKFDVDKFKKITNKVLTVFLGAVLLIVVVCVFAVTVQLARGNKASLFGYRFYYILTDSMTPYLEVNDVVLSRVLSNEDEIRAHVHEGDVITFISADPELSGMTITHRAYSDPYQNANGEWYIETKGDKLGAPVDTPIPLGNVQGVMIKKVAIVSNIYEIFTSTVGLILLIVVPCVAILGSLIFRLVDLLKKKPAAAPLTEEQQAERERLTESIKEQAVREYLELEAKKKEIAEKAVADFLAKQQAEVKPQEQAQQTEAKSEQPEDK